MDPTPPGGKRSRLSSWSASAAHDGSISHLRSSKSAQLPPQPPAAQAPRLRTSSVPYQQPYPPRPADDASPPPPAPAATAQVPVRTQPQHAGLDHRRSDPEILAPVPDHYPPLSQPQQQQPQQPSPSPAHPHHYHQYSPQDSVIKREAPEDPRANRLTGPSSNPTPHTTHTTSVPPSSASLQSSAYQPENQRHMNFDERNLGPPVSAPYRNPSFLPPTTPHQPPYESHVRCTSAAPDTLYSVYSSVAAAKKKNTRASQACDQCRQLKAKCDETKPCKTCRDKGTECRYRDPVPKAIDKAQADILEGINFMQNSIATLVEHVGHMNERINRIERSFSRLAGSGLASLDPPIGEEVKDADRRSPTISDEIGHHRHEEAYSEQTTAPVERTVLRMMAEDEMEVEPGPPVLPGEPAIPINHTTLAGLLLEWPSIRDLTRKHLEKGGIRYIGEYPISQEQNRGILIVYGRGEDGNASRSGREIPDHGQLSMADDSSDVASPSLAVDWGHLGGLSPGDRPDHKAGLLGYDGNPDFSEAKVRTYVQSFKDNILNMHPIIQPRILDDWVQQFLDALPRVQHGRQSKAPASSKSFAGTGSSGSAQVEPAGLKRKRSPGLDYHEPSPSAGAFRIGRPERTIHNALILIILALGKICLHRENIPDAVHQGDHPPFGSPLHRNGIPASPAQGSPPCQSSQSQSSGLASPNDLERGIESRRSSVHGVMRTGYNLRRNYEAIPGLEYFAFATDILGNYIGAYRNMKNVYANIFAGLYQGQLARPMESFAYIHQAGHKLQVIMRPSLDRLRRIKLNREFIQDAKYNQLALAFWTCLQLESDLIAELPLPPSGLLSYEDDMPHPNMSLLQDFDQRILDSYPGQLYLRTHLNSIHRMFYSPEEPGADVKKVDDKYKSVELVADAVSGMHWVAPSYAFKEDDPPASDILSARLRAKYWGAQVITYRPFIKMILQASEGQKQRGPHPDATVATKPQQHGASPMVAPHGGEREEFSPKVVELARRGIRALIESTRAFHGLEEKRPIITNVFGTAHAQWGNLLVLSAAYKNPVLFSSVDEELLQTLFQKTIQFLRQSSTTTGSLRVDMLILEGLQRDLFPQAGPKANSSFSSSTGQLTPNQPRAASMATPHGMTTGTGPGLGATMAATSTALAAMQRSR